MRPPVGPVTGHYAIYIAEKIIAQMIEDFSIMASFGPDDIRRCETCGVFLTRDEWAPIEDVTLCWRAATDKPRDADRCWRDRPWRKAIFYKADLPAILAETMARLNAPAP